MGKEKAEALALGEENEADTQTDEGAKTGSEEY